MEGDGRGESRPAEVVERLLLVRRIAVGQVHLAVGTGGPNEPVRRVPVSGPELEHALGPDAAGEDLDHDSAHAADDGEAPRLGFSLHLQQDGFVATGEQTLDVALDGRIGHVHRARWYAWSGSVREASLLARFVSVSDMS